MWGPKIFEGIWIVLLSFANHGPARVHGLVATRFSAPVPGHLPVSLPSHLNEALVVTKEINKNSVHYDVIPNDDCTFDTKNPMNIYWTVFDPEKNEYKRENLNFVEKFIYGLEIEMKSSDTLIAEVKALKKKNIRMPMTFKLKKDRRGCRLDRGSDLTRIHLQKFLNSKPTQAVLFTRSDQTKVSLE